LAISWATLRHAGDAYKVWTPAETPQVVRSMVPLSEMFGYATDLRAETQGRASYSMECSEYAEVPKNVANRIIAERT